MSLRLPDNLMVRPLQPGGISDGSEYVTRTFGNRDEQMAAAPNAPAGFSGAVNQAAGAEGQAFAKAAESINTSIQDTAAYFDNLHAADDDAKAQLLDLGIKKGTAELRDKQAKDPVFTAKSVDEQQNLYAFERDIMVDDLKLKHGLTHKKVVKAVDLGIERYKMSDTADYRDRVVIPRVVERRQLIDGQLDKSTVEAVVVAPTAENTAAAAKEITERYSSPQALALYTVTTAEKMKLRALGALSEGVMNSARDKLAESPMMNPTGGAITAEDFASGAYRQQVLDEKGRLSVLLQALPISEQERTVMRMQGEKYIEQQAKLTATGHNKVVKEAEKVRVDEAKDQIDTYRSQLGIAAMEGKLSGAQAHASYTKMIADPLIKSDPQLVKAATQAYEHVVSKLKERESEQRRAATERKVTQTLNELRIANQIAVSGAGADGVWKRDGTLQTFFTGGNVLTPALLGKVAEAGSVPSSVIGSIQYDLRSSDPKVQQRGVQNMMALKNHSARTQAALYKDMPEGFSGVVQSLEAGKSLQDSLAFLSRPRQPPDVDAKLRTEAHSRTNKAEFDAALKKVPGFNTSKMSTATRAVFEGQWAEAFSQANGNLALAKSLFGESAAKSKNYGRSEFTDAVEQYPATRFVPKETVTAMVYQDFPETKGKVIKPFFSGVMTPDGKPTYDVYVEDKNGLLTPVTTPQRRFYMTDEAAAKAATTKLSAAGEAAKEERDRRMYIEKRQADSNKKASMVK